jgi:WD40 repeat protein
MILKQAPMKRRLFLLVAVPLSLAAALYFVVPPQPRCVIEGRLWPVSLSDDGTTLVTYASDGEKYCGPVQVWDTRIGACLRSYDSKTDANFFGVSVSPDQRYLLRAGSDTLHCSDWRNDRTWSISMRAQLVDDFSPDGRHVRINLQGEFAAKIHELETGREIADAGSEDTRWDGWHACGGAAVLYGRHFERKQGSYFCLQELATSKMLMSWDCIDPNRVLSPDGWTLVIDMEDRDRDLQVDFKARIRPWLEVWDLQTLQERGRIPLSSKTLHKRPRLAISPDGRTLLVTPEVSGQILQLWDLHSLKRIHQIEIPDEYLEDIFFTPDSQSLMTLTASEPLQFSMKPKRLAQWNVATGAERWRREYGTIHSGLLGAQFFENGGKVALVSFVGTPPLVRRSVSVLTTETGQLVHEICDMNSDYSHGSENRGIFTETTDPKKVPQWKQKMNAWLPSLFPLSKTDQRVFDLATGRTLARVQHFVDEWPGHRLDERAALSKDGTTWVTLQESPGHTDGHCLRVWDVPQATSWRWVLGPPLAWLAVASAWLTWLAWRRRREPAAERRGLDQVPPLDSAHASQP